MVAVVVVEPPAECKWSRLRQLAAVNLPQPALAALADEPVVVVNEAFVRLHFPGQDVVGMRITNDRPPTEGSFWRTIVGVVGDEHQAALSVPAYRLWLASQVIATTGLCAQ